MNDRLRLFPTAGSIGSARLTRRLIAAAADFARRGLALGLIALLVPLSSPAAWAQQAPPPPPPDQYQGAPPDDQGPPPNYNPLNPQQLDQLVAPIALYPDSLVAQVLAASTYPTQVVDADRFMQANQGVPPGELTQMVNSQPWDPSIKALTAFPTVLNNMDRNLDWTTNLGNAYYNQPQDVMEAVQAMRQEAYQRGDLRSTPQEEVSYSPGDIVIEPVNPNVVYVPYYNPWTVWGFRPWYAYYTPPPPRGVVFVGGLALGFGFGVVVTSWSHWGWGWGHWGMGWGPHPYIMHDHAMFAPYRGYAYGHFDRNPQARMFNRQVQQHARAVGYAHGFAAGERNGYNHGYNRGEANRPGQNFNRPANNYRGEQNRSQNFNRPNNNYRGQQNRGQNFNRPNNARPQQNRNFNRPAARPNNRPAQRGQARPRSNNQRPHGNDRPRGGGDHGDHGHGR